MRVTKPALQPCHDEIAEVERSGEGAMIRPKWIAATLPQRFKRPHLFLLWASLLSSIGHANADSDLIPQVTLKYTGGFGEALSAEQACQEMVPLANDHDLVRFKKYTSATPSVDPELGLGCMASGIFYSGYNLEDEEPFTQFERWISEVKGCPAGYEEVDSYSPPMCRLNELAAQNGNPESSCAAEPGMSPSSDDPFNLGTGNKFYSEVDYTSSGSQPISFARYYNSGDGTWRHSYSAKVIQADQLVIVQLEDGMADKFTMSGGQVVANGARLGELQQDGAGWSYRSPKRVKYRFSNSGLLVSKTSGSIVENITRSGSRITASNNSGRTISFTETVDGAPLSLQAGTLNVSYVYDDQLRLINVVNTYANGTKSKEYHYEDPNYPKHLTGVTGEDGIRSATWGYDGGGRIATSQSSDGTTLFSVSYEQDQSVVTGPLGSVDVYRLTSVGGIKRIASIEGERFGRCPNTNSTFAYDAKAQLLSKTDSRGFVTKYERDSAGQEISRTYAAGTPEQFTVTTTWHSPGKPSSIETPVSRTVLSYDEAGNVTQRAVSDLQAPSSPPRVTTFSYDSAARLVGIDGPRTDLSDILTYSYDGSGNLISATNALGHQTRFSNHDEQGYPGLITDPNGVETTVSYSPEGWAEALVVDGHETRFEYDAVGRVVKQTMPNGAWERYSYNLNGNLTGIETASGYRVTYAVDPMGNRTETKHYDASGNEAYSHSRFYNELGKLLRDTGAGGQTYSLDYAEGDNLTAITNPNQGVIAHAFDGLNRLITSTDPLGGITSYTYDQQSRLNGVTDPRGAKTTYQYDGLGNLVKLTSPDTGVTTFEHDAAGNVVRKTDARGVVTTFIYDALNRLKSVSYPSSPSLSVHYGYDMAQDGNYGVGRLTAIQDSGGLIGYKYDRRGNLVEQIRSVPVQSSTHEESLRYGFDGANKLTSIDYPAGFRVNYQRTAGEVTSVELSIGTTPPSMLASDIRYMPFGPLQGLTWGNGIPLFRQYDQDYQLTLQQIGGETASYGYDLNGNIVGVQKAMEAASLFQYDALDRLNEESDGSVRKAYSYDANGNRQSRVTSFTSAEQPQEDQIQALEIAQGSNKVAKMNGRNVTRDAAGNTLQQEAGIRYTYDAQGRLKQVYQSSSLRADYRYNALGQRTVKQVYSGGSVIGTTTFLYGRDGQLLGQTEFAIDGKKSRSQYLVWLDQMPIAAIELKYGADGRSITSMQKFFLHSDHLNAPRFATNEEQVVQWQWKSDAFGVGPANTDVDGDGTHLQIALRFPGQQYDEHSRLNYNYFRDYDPQTGRYVESDPIGLKGGLNTYGYVGGNPLAFTDSSGLILEYGSEYQNDINKIRKSPKGNEIVTQLEKSEMEYRIVKPAYGCNAKFDGEPWGGTITMTPGMTGWVSTKNGGFALASSDRILLHELGHAYNRDQRKGPMYNGGNAFDFNERAAQEEQFVIDNYENPYDSSFERKDHSRVCPVMTCP